MNHLPRAHVPKEYRVVLTVVKEGWCKGSVIMANVGDVFAVNVNVLIHTSLAVHRQQAIKLIIILPY